MHRQKKRISLTDKGLQIRQPAERVIADMLQNVFADSKRPVIIAVGGPGGTGKSSFCEKLSQNLNDSAVLGLDNYRTPRSERSEKGIYGSNPEANHIDLLLRHLESMHANKPFDMPCYDIGRGIADSTKPYTPARLNILDGEISVHKQLRSHVDFSIFIDAHWRTQLATRIYRDVDERGATPEKAIRTFLQSNLIDAPRYSGEAKPWADIVLFCTDDFRFEIREVSAMLWQIFQMLI
jgi:uridine kinase